MIERIKTPRIRIFAGPNGSGKSTVIQTVRNKKINGRNIDFGYYVNADDIASALGNQGFSFSGYYLKELSQELFTDIALSSGLIDNAFPKARFLASFTFRGKKIISQDSTAIERLAQVIADFLRKRLLAERKKFSFETVFSHHGKLEFMQEASQVGYKVYLYFVATESPEINIARVKARVEKGGHDVPTDKIRSRYDRSLSLLYEAAQMAYQVFFFDNSGEEQDASLFAHFKRARGKKKWDKNLIDKEIPEWFITYYSNKIKKK